MADIAGRGEANAAAAMLCSRRRRRWSVAWRAGCAEAGIVMEGHRQIIAGGTTNTPRIYMATLKGKNAGWTDAGSRRFRTRHAKFRGFVGWADAGSPKSNRFPKNWVSHLALALHWHAKFVGVKIMLGFLRQPSLLASPKKNTATNNAGRVKMRIEGKFQRVHSLAASSGRQHRIVMWQECNPPPRNCATTQTNHQSS